MTTLKSLFAILVICSICVPVINGMDLVDLAQRPKSLFEYHNLEILEQASPAVKNIFAKNIVGPAGWWYRGELLPHDSDCSVMSVAYTQGGSLIIGTDDRRAVRWDLPKKSSTILSKITGVVTSVRVSHDDSILAIASKNDGSSNQKEVKFINLLNLNQIATYRTPSNVQSVVFHPLKKHALIALNQRSPYWASGSGEVIVVNLDGKEAITVIPSEDEYEEGCITAFATHPKETMYALAWETLPLYAKCLYLLGDTGNKIGELKTEEQACVVAFQPQGKLLAAGCEKGKIGLWDLDGNKLPTLRHWRCSLVNASYPDKAGGITDIKFHPMEKLIAIASGWGYVQLKNFEGHGLVELRQYSVVREVAFHPNGESLAAVGDNHSLILDRSDNAAIIWKQHKQLTLGQVLLRKVFQDYFKECIKTGTKPEVCKSKDDLVPWMAKKFNIMQDELDNTWNSLPEDLRISIMNTLLFRAKWIALYQK